MKKENAIVCDGILEKFRGNKSYDWETIHAPQFYASIHEEYYVVENHLNFLLGQGINELEEYEHNYKKYIRLSRKGFYTISDLKHEGYIAKWKKENRAKWWKYVAGGIAILTFLLVSVRFIKDYYFK
jgi:hypothetical protein